MDPLVLLLASFCSGGVVFFADGRLSALGWQEGSLVCWEWSWEQGEEMVNSQE